VLFRSLANVIADLRTQLHNDGTRAAATSHINCMVEARPGKIARQMAKDFVTYAKAEIAKQDAERIARDAHFAKYRAA
jgi:hypothetical protein